MRHSFLSLARKAFIVVFIVPILAACWGASNANTPDHGAPSGGASHTDLPTVRPTDVPATLAPTALPTVTLLPPLDRPIIWYLRGETPADLPKVNEQLNRLLAERDFNARVELRIVAQSAFERRMADILSAGEAWDLVSLSVNSYPTWLERNALLPLAAYLNPTTSQAEDLVRKHAPWLLAVKSQAGGVYAVTNPSVWTRPRGVSIRADVVQALNLQAELDQAHSFADLTPLLAKIQAAVEDGTLKASNVANGGKIRRAAGQADLLQPDNAGYDRMWGPFAVGFADQQGKIINWYQSAEFRDLANLRRDWQIAGYLPDEPLTPDQVTEGYLDGRYVVEVGCPVWAGSALERAWRYGYEWTERPLAPLFLQTEAVFSSQTGVNARIANDPERVHRVMLFLALLRSDRGIYNLLAYGIEGQHWQWADRENQTISFTPDSGYQPGFIDQLGDRSLSYAAGTTNSKLWIVVGEQNAKAPASVGLGFMFDPRPVAAETGAVNGLTTELLDPLATGQAKNVEKTISVLQKSLDEVGLHAIQAELEQQWAEWRQANK
jgi:putative aldouronate transport system substrate-binding protein